MHAELTKVKLAKVENAEADNVPIRLYRPSLEPNLPCIVFYHGGGWVIGDLETHDAPCRMLAADTGFVVIAVDYVLAPGTNILASTEWLLCSVLDCGTRIRLDIVQII